MCKIDKHVYIDVDDFELSGNGVLELTALQTADCLTLTLLNDDVREFNETAILTLVPENSRDQVVGDGFTIVIIDDGDGQSMSAFSYMLFSSTDVVSFMCNIC